MNKEQIMERLKIIKTYENNIVDDITLMRNLIGLVNDWLWEKEFDLGLRGGNK